jgi:hypothetical protein
VDPEVLHNMREDLRRSMRIHRLVARASGLAQVQVLLTARSGGVGLSVHRIDPNSYWLQGDVSTHNASGFVTLTGHESCCDGPVTCGTCELCTRCDAEFQRALDTLGTSIDLRIE